MEPKLIRKDIKYQKKTLIIVSVLVACLFIGGSFSLLSSSSETKDVVTFSTGNFDLEVAVTGTLSLEGEVPKSYEDGFKSNDITLTLTNTGSLEIGKYEVKLEGDSTTTLGSNYIRYSVSDDEGKTYLASKLLSETNNIIYTGYSLKTSKVLKVKLWIDEEAGEDALKKSYNGKIKVELYQNEDTAVQVVKSKLVSNYSGSNESFVGGLVAVNSDGNLYNETNSEIVREYRYSGPTVNNYVTFNDELWRIVGVFKEGEEEFVKIVRNKVLEEDKFPEFYKMNENDYLIQSQKENETINSNEYTRFYEKKEVINNKWPNNDWTIAGLQYYLNTEEDESTESKNKGYFSYLSADSKKMLRKTTYYLGIVSTNIDANYSSDGAKKAYEHERSTTRCPSSLAEKSNENNCFIWYNNKETWDGFIGLLYPSDIGYTLHERDWNATSIWVKNEVSWLKKIINVNIWLLSPSSLYTNYNTWLYVSPDLTSIQLTSFWVSNRAGAVLPTLYLKSNVKIISGTGEENNPYILTME